MRIGIMTMKPAKEYKGQFIGTRFVVVGVPILPLQSFFYLDSLTERAVPIGLYWKQAIKIYMIFIALAGIFTTWALRIDEHSSSYIESETTAQAIIAACILCIVYFMFFFTKTGSAEKELRELYGEATGINALPGYLNKHRAKELQNGFIQHFESQYKTDWQELIKKNSYSKEQVPLLFAITGYQKRISGDHPYADWYEKLMKEYKSYRVDSEAV